MIYQIKNRRLILDNDKSILLTRLEHKLLLILSNSEMNTYDKILKKMYGHSDHYTYKCLIKVKSILCKKTNLNIINLYGYGYKLDSEIYFE